MNILIKHTLFSSIVISLITSINTQCMHIKNLKIKSITLQSKHYSSKKTISNFFKPPRTVEENEQIIRKLPLKSAIELIKKHQAHEAAMKAIQESDEGTVIAIDPPIESWSTKEEHSRAPLQPFKREYPHIEPEPWSYEKAKEISVDDFLYGLKELEKLHKAHNDQFDKE